jgi:hypothetical protein
MSRTSVTDLNQNTAAALFIKKLIQHAYHGTIRDIKKLLERGPSWPSPAERDVELHNWFTELDAESRDLVLQVVEETASAVIFHTLTIFDGVAGTLLPGKITELLIELRVYDGVKQIRSRTPSISVELNPRGVPSDELHDLFQHMLAQHSSKG